MTPDSSSALDEPSTEVIPAIAPGAMDQNMVDRFQDALTSLTNQVENDSPIAEVPPKDSSREILEEIAEDMLAMTRRLGAIEQATGNLQSRMDQLDARTYEMGRGIAQQVDLLRRELIGDKAGLLARNLFNSIVSHIDALVAMREDLEHGKDRQDKHNRRLARQIEALELSLVTALQSLGFYQFKAAAGDDFNASRMEAVGFGEGKPGQVLRPLRPGFETKEGVMRRAGVIIAKPAALTA